MIEAVFWFSVVASLALLWRGLASRSWIAMWVGALGSFVLSILSMFSIGAFVFALTCLELAAVVALRWHLSPLQSVTILLAGAMVWVLIVPAQIYGIEWLGGFGVYQLVGLLGLILVLLPIDRIQSMHATASEARPSGSPPVRP